MTEHRDMEKIYGQSRLRSVLTARKERKEGRINLHYSCISLKYFKSVR